MIGSPAAEWRPVTMGQTDGRAEAGQPTGKLTDKQAGQKARQQAGKQAGKKARGTDDEHEQQTQHEWLLSPH